MTRPWAYVPGLLLADPQRYRVTLLCGCNNDLAYGYGATLEEARANARLFWRKHHGRRKVREEVVERATNDGTHYEEVQS